MTQHLHDITIYMTSPSTIILATAATAATDEQNEVDAVDNAVVARHQQPHERMLVSVIVPLLSEAAADTELQQHEHKQQQQRKSKTKKKKKKRAKG